MPLCIPKTRGSGPRTLLLSFAATRISCRSMRIESSDLLLTSVERALLPTLMIQRDAQGAIEPSSIACHYCESDSIQVVAAKKPWVGFEKISGNYKQYYCNACGLFFIEPTPSQGDILNFFQEDYNRSRYSANTDRKSTRLNSSHVAISYAVFCLKKK